MSNSLQTASAVGHVLADGAANTAGAGTTVAVGGSAGMLLLGLTWAVWRYVSSHRQDKQNNTKKIHHSHRANTVISLIIGLLVGSATALGAAASHVASMIP